jgi:hypothetical protein
MLISMIICRNRRVYGQTNTSSISIFCVFILLSALLCNVCSATEYYVSPGGNNGNSGTSIADPWRTLQYAADHAGPGDIINIMSGTFTATGWEPIINLDPNHSGTPDAWITYRPAPGHHPILKSAGYMWQLLKINANYIKIEGLELIGNNAAITLQQAEDAYQQAIGPSPPWGTLGWFNTNGIEITNAHHVTVSACVIHDFQGAGVGTGTADYITIEDNIIYNNAWYSFYAHSGISLWASKSIDSFTGRKNFIRRNICFNNKTLIKWVS